MWPHSSTERANERIQRSLRFVPPGLPRQLQARIAEPLASAALVAACPERHPFPSDAVMTDWQEALERLQIFTDPNAAVTDATVIRAHIEGLEASIRSLSPLNYEERCRLRDAEARVRELEADAGYAEHRVDCRHATYAAEACDCGLDAAMLPAVRDGDSRVEAEGK